MREPGSEQFNALAERTKDGQPFVVDVLYSDVEGGQRVITRLGLSRLPGHDGEAEDEGNEWAISAARHWNLDRPDPR